MKLKKLTIHATMIAAGAVYPYSDSLLAMGARETRYGEAYNMFRTIGTGAQRRILVPRNLAPYCDNMNMADGLDVSFVSKFVPRNSEQSRVIDESVQLLADGVNFLMECPTGFGKTWCTMDIIAKVGKKTLIVVTKEDIRDQWIVAAEKLLGLTPKDIGLIQGDTFQVAGKKLVIAMVQSLAKEERYPLTALSEFGLVIWDEVHRVGADYFSQSCFRCPAKLRLGLSATPDRKDGREEVIHAHIGRVMVRTEAAPLTPRILARRSPWTIPLTSVKDPKTGKSKVGPIPHSPGKCGHVINMLASNHPRNSMLANFTAQAYKVGRTILVQSDRKEHLETLAMMIQKLGVPPSQIGYYLGGMTQKQREHAKVKKVILATYQMTAEATDIPWLDTLVMGTPKSDVRQIVGRIIRQFEGKKNAGEEGPGFDPLVFDLIDDSSNVFAGYWNARRDWYAKVKAPVDRSHA